VRVCNLMPSLTEHQVLRFLAQLILLVVTARVLADLFQRIGQATVIGELLAGIVLGPSILGRLMPGLYGRIFAPDPVGGHLLEAFAWVGMIMLLLNTGIETDLDILRGVGRPAVLVSALGIVLPLAGGFALGWWLPANYLVKPDQRVIFAMFMAVAMSISAVPVIAKILIDLDLMRRELGLLILAAGVLDDSVGWLLLSVVAGLAARGKIDLRTLSVIVGATVAFIAFCYFAGFRMVSFALRWVDDRGVVEHASLTTMVAIAFRCAIITQAIGVHAVFGAFVGGLMVGRSHRMRKSDREKLEAVTMGFLAPIFFAYSGLKADVFALNGWSIPALVLGVACFGKFFGCGLGGLLGGLRPREAFAVASGMNARGGMEIVVALLGLSLGVLTPQMYTVIVMVAVITSLIAPSLLNWSLREIPPRAGEAERSEHDKVMGRLPFVREGAKLLVLDAGGANTQLATHLAAALGNHRDASITIFQATAKNPAVDAEEASKRFTHLKSIAGLCGASNVYQRSAAGDSISEVILQECQRGYDAIFAGAAISSKRETMGGDVLGALLRDAPAPVIIARHYGDAVPFKRVLAPTNGASYSRLGVTVAMYYAQSIQTDVTVLYVMEAGGLFFPGLPYGWKVQRAGQQIVDEMKVLGSHLDLDIATQIGVGAKREQVILRAVNEGTFDLLVMGVLYRSVEERLYFGPKVARILERAKCAVAVVVSPEKV
jgi:Kef-type K+ transport system membrane component KefB